MSLRARAYAWEPAEGIEHARHVTLFPGKYYDEVGHLAGYRAAMKAVSDAERFADAVEALFDPDSEGATRALEFWEEMATT